MRMDDSARTNEGRILSEYCTISLPDRYKFIAEKGNMIERNLKLVEPILKN